ncbi:uncharacterized protein LOC126971843 [Leptidea sinapis]|uniref:uncharacterized protein LOC126971843 n=1 Tax=Leptidea sinapis TaxID=189913 RepID=UPI0021C42E1D|nr:uncharacterized protein LOC126971843 [Leptidea sinapis]
MVHEDGPHTSYEERSKKRLHVLYTKQTEERQSFMHDLHNVRKYNTKRMLKLIKDAVGPKWYHTLSVPQQLSLDKLEFSIYQDLLEGRPVRTAAVIRELGIFPGPDEEDLMSCVYLGRDDPKEMLAQLFLVSYGHTIDGKQLSYCLNAKLMLSGILYLGMDNLLDMLKQRFKAEPEKKTKDRAPKAPPQSPLKSPYLQDMVAALYLPPRKKPFQPPPLPNLDDLNEPFEEEPPIPKPPPPPPPPPPPKKRLPISYCEKLAGITDIRPKSQISPLIMQRPTNTRLARSRTAKMSEPEVKKTYGIGIPPPNRNNRRKKLKPPQTGIWNAQYTITGVYKIQGKSVFVLGNVSILPPLGELIHGGFRLLNGEYVNIHCGFRGLSPPPKPDPCDCVKRWQTSVFKYLKETKCQCGHYYDYGNEGTFPPEELPLFEKPTKFLPFKFNYQTIYNIDEKELLVQKEFKRIWETDSALHVPDPNAPKKDKKKKRSSATCLGQKPKPEDYLKCALRWMRRANVAARLPDVQLVPELKEWMRKRIYGPYSDFEKKEMLRKSNHFWQMFLTLAANGFGHVDPPQVSMFSGHTTWIYKQKLNDKFRTYTKRYRLSLFRSLADVNNIFWRTMFQAQFPDKKFREIYFSYLFGRMEDLQLMHPYSSRETMERALTVARNRYICLPPGAEYVEK